MQWYVIRRTVLATATACLFSLIGAKAATVQAIEATCDGAASCTTQVINAGDLRLLAVAGTGPDTRIQGDFGEVCVSGFCGGAPGPEVQPFQAQLTGSSFVCFGDLGGSPPCNPFGVTFSVFGANLTAGTPLTAVFAGSLVYPIIGGPFGPVLGNFHMQVSDNNGNLDQVNLPFSISSAGAFRFVAPTIVMSSSGLFHLTARLDVQQTETGEILNLPSSASIRFAEDAAEVPEPSAAPGIAIGVLAIAYRRILRNGILL